MPEIDPFEEGFEVYLELSGLTKEAKDTLRATLLELEPEVLLGAVEDFEKAANSMVDAVAPTLTPNAGIGIAGRAGMGAAIGAGYGALEHLFKTPEEKEKEGLVASMARRGLGGAGIGAGIGAVSEVGVPAVQNYMKAAGMVEKGIAHLAHAAYNHFTAKPATSPTTAPTTAPSPTTQPSPGQTLAAGAASMIAPSPAAVASFTPPPAAPMPAPAPASSPMPALASAGAPTGG